MYAANLITVPNTLPSTVVDLGAMFLGASLFNDANISDWDVSRVESMSYMFSETAAFAAGVPVVGCCSLLARGTS
jgi:hypothetical protein